MVVHMCPSKREIPRDEHCPIHSPIRSTGVAARDYDLGEVTLQRMKTAYGKKKCSQSGKQKSFRIAGVAILWAEASFGKRSPQPSAEKCAVRPVGKLFLRWSDLGAHPQGTGVGRTPKEKPANVAVNKAELDGNVSCTCPVLEFKTDKNTNLTVLATSQLHCDFSLDLKVKIDLKVSDWRTIYLAASNPEKISENGPFHTFMRNVELDDENGIITLTFFVKSDGECVKKTVHGIKREDGVYIIRCKYDPFTVNEDASVYMPVFCSPTDAGTNEFKVIQASENVLIASNINVDEEGMQTTLTGVFAKGDDIDDELFETFKEVTIGKEIPEENILKLISFGNETTLFPEYIIHGGRK
ncbi:Odorant-binding protein [Camelus dromedarius]|uniref:Odorant-binding protein n=1 Tax=Camelus dromedarius TaxID=9838 RepID=A0A5N4C215_CAMDR|nr:Odorant-binding protein [Camelus dromedarius]